MPLQEPPGLLEYLLDSLITTIPDNIYFKDRESRFVRINQALARWFGLADPAEAIGKTDRDFFSDEHALQAYEDEQRVMATGQPLVGIEEKETWPDGRVTWVSTTKAPIRDAAGEVVGLVGVSRDISGRRRAEEALANERALLRAVIDLLPTLVYAKDTQCRKILSNPVDVKFMGAKTEAEVLGKTDFDFYPPDTAARFFQRDQEIIQTGRPFLNYEHTIATAGGEQRWLVTSKVQLRDSTGQVIGLVGVGHDITERKHAEEALRASEQRFRSVFDAAIDGLLLADIETGAFIMANPAICQMLGYTEQELLRLSVPDIHPKESVAAVQEAFRRQATEEQRLSPGTPLRRKDGTTFLADVSGRPLEMDRRKCLLGAFRDMTAFKDMEAQMRQSQKMEAVGQLAGGVAHDFNNILGVILGYCDLILRGLRDEDPLTRSLRQIRTSAERAAALTRQLLAFSRRQTLRPEVVDLNATVRGLTDMLRRLIGENVDLATSLSGDLGRVKADPGQVEQVIINLAVNARDAMPQGGHLLIQTANVELDGGAIAGAAKVRPGPYVTLALADDGCGMDEGTKGRIFEPFFTTKEKGRGTGLGLSTVYGIVKQSDGYIQVESAPGRGATFTVYLPRTDEKAAAKAKRPAPGDRRGKGQGILLVEDEQALRDVIRDTLESLGYRVTVAANGAEALLTIERDRLRPDLLVTDIVMPGISGAALARRLRDAQPSLRVLYMSGYTDNAALDHGVLESGVPFIQKPFRIDDLAEKVAMALQPDGLDAE